MEMTPKWEYVADNVMGGVSHGEMTQEAFRGRSATVLRGDVSLENGGGFLQIASDINTDDIGGPVREFSGFDIEVCGNGERYDIRLRTTQLSRPWQSFRTDFQAPQDWQKHRIPFDVLEPHRTEAAFHPAQLRRVGILAVGRAFHAEIAVAKLTLYRD